ncbi:condensation domain-containing protein [Nocardioides sp. InS609-2]|uniref:condensation domain-containing protein n=1 Tax=Nocardioides sp. InS609-2 TaxID=2760705 RepID=UPI0020C187F0|nr:condensation domain-containing protein [Nocardioides sp. InS609-2]
MSVEGAVHRGPTSLAEEVRLRGTFSHWHNLLYEIWWLTGPLEVNAVRDAWRRVCLRHDAMRRTYASPVEALTHRDPVAEVELHTADTDDEAAAIMRRSLGTPFDLGGDRFTRIVLVQRDDQRHLLGISVDHVISDEMSWQYLMQDFNVQYRQALERTAPDTAESRTYRDFASAMREDFDGAWGSERREFWTGYTRDFGNIPPSFSLQGESKAEPDMTTLALDLPADGTAMVCASASQARATPFSVIASAMLSSMQEVSGEDAAGLLFHHHGRFTPGCYGTLGLFTQGVPVHLRGTSPSRLDTVRDVFHRSVQTSDHILSLDIAGDTWSRSLISPRASEVFLGVTEGRNASTNVRLPGITAESVEMKFDGAAAGKDTIVFVWTLRESHPHVTATYNRNLFPDESVDRLLRLAAAHAVEPLEQA